MSRYYQYLFMILVLMALSVAVLGYILWDGKPVSEEYNSVGRTAKIRPDYYEAVIPPNIAPLNFLVQETGSNYYIKIYSENGEPLEIFSRSAKIRIPPKPWRKLLNKNKGKKLYFDIFVKTQKGQWDKFNTITNKIANERIDAFLVYRKIRPLHLRHREHEKIGIYQRNLGDYGESLILDNTYYYKYGCLNCHTFCQNQSDKMLIAIRNSKHGSCALLVEGDRINKIPTKFGYTSWHPTGRLAIYSMNKVRQFFHSVQNEVRDVIDLDSALAYYSVDGRTIKIPSEISKEDRLETYPTWSADGRYLYYCSAPILWDREREVLTSRYKQVKYDLMRVNYNVESDTWGQPETVLSAQDTALSILEPRISPDGRWLLFCMCDYGCFPVYQESSDLYLIDLEAASRTGRYEYRRIEANSGQSESWHSWSSNSRWIAFSSKRRDGVLTRLYFSYVDKAGKVYKPILMPQKDPTFYDSLLLTLNTPEFIVEPVKVTGEKLGRVVRSSRQIQVDMPVTMATPQAGTISDYTAPQ